MSDYGESAQRSKVERIVHEAMLTLAVLPPVFKRQRQGYWPVYIYEADDHGNKPDINDEPPRARPPWNPRPRHIDELDRVLAWYGGYKGRDRRQNGIFRWEYALLEVRGTQFLWGKPSWRKIATAMESVDRAPTRSYEWWRSKHDELIQIAERRAVVCGDAGILAKAA